MFDGFIGFVPHAQVLLDGVFVHVLLPVVDVVEPPPPVHVHTVVPHTQVDGVFVMFY